MSAKRTVGERPIKDTTQRRGDGKKGKDGSEHRKKLPKMSTSDSDTAASAAAGAKSSLKAPDGQKGTEKQSKVIPPSSSGSAGSGGGCSENETAPLLTAVETAYEARINYEQLLMRYGNWPRIRRNVFGYVVIILFCTFIKSFVDLLTMTSKMGTIVNGTSLTCCCGLDRVPEKTRAEEWIAQYSTMSILSYTSVFLAIVGPPLELYVGRRKAMLVGLAFGAVSAFGVTFATSPFMIKLYFYGKMLMDLLILMLSFTTFVELVPYNLRIICPMMVHMGEALGLALNSLFFLRLSVHHYGIYLGITFMIGFIIAYYFTTDSVCHLIVTRRLEQAEDKIAELELEHVSESTDKVDRFPERAAKKIYEDLAYLDRDELKMLEFLRKLVRSQKLRAIIFLVIQSFSCGFLEFETLRMYAERFARPNLLVWNRILAYSLSFVLMFFLRKTNRVRTMTILLGMMLITIAFRRIFLSFDHRNGCGSHLFVLSRFALFSYLTNMAMGALLYSYQAFIMLHFLEVAPSILRSACTVLVYVPMKISFSVGYWMLENYRGLSDFRYAIYLMHCVVLVCMLFRDNTTLPFTVYFVDLIPEEPSYREVDGEDYKEQTPRSYDSPHIKSDREGKNRKAKPRLKRSYG